MGAREALAIERAIRVCVAQKCSQLRFLQAPQVREHFVKNGYDPQGVPPAEWAKLFQADLKRYAEICRIAGIEPQ